MCFSSVVCIASDGLDPASTYLPALLCVFSSLRAFIRLYLFLVFHRVFRDVKILNERKSACGRGRMGTCTCIHVCVCVCVCVCLCVCRCVHYAIVTICIKQLGVNCIVPIQNQSKSVVPKIAGGWRF